MAHQLWRRAGGAGSTNPTPSPSVTFTNFTNVVARGANFFVEASSGPDEIEVRIDGILLQGLETNLIYAEAVGAIYQVPASITPGTATLSVRLKGASTDGDSETMTITEPIFLDEATACGIDQEHKATGEAHMCMPLSTGVALSDYDNDGDTDMYLGNLDVPGRLMRNEGDTDNDGLPNFVQVTDSGLGETKNISSINFVDYDNDGDKDLFIGRWGYNFMFKNTLMETGEVRFVSISDTAGFFKVKNRAMGSAWGDFDNDGDLDLYVTKHTHCALDPENIPMLSEDQLFRNNGNDTFEDVTKMLDPTGGLSQRAGVRWPIGWIMTWMAIRICLSSTISSTPKSADLTSRSAMTVRTRIIQIIGCLPIFLSKVGSPSIRIRPIRGSTPWASPLVTLITTVTRI